MGKAESSEWILIKKTFPEGVRYLLQQRRIDATKPYYLTQRIFRYRGKALDALHTALKTGKP